VGSFLRRERGSSCRRRDEFKSFFTAKLMWGKGKESTLLKKWGAKGKNDLSFPRKGKKSTFNPGLHSQERVLTLLPIKKLYKQREPLSEEGEGRG